MGKKKGPSAEQKFALAKKQIEFYFCDSNFPGDKFLRGTAEEANGWVPISLVNTFKRLKSIGLRDEDIPSVVKDSDVVIVDDDKKNIRRKHPLPQELNITPRSLYAKGFPLDVTIDEVSTIFETVGKVNCVRMRRYPNTREFKGSCFIELESQEAVQKALDMTFKCRGEDLTVLAKQAWLDEKKQERILHKKQHATQPGAKTATATATATSADAISTSTSAQPHVEYTHGLIVKFENVPEDVTREVIAAECEKHGIAGELKFVDYSTGTHTARVRFNTPQAADKVVASAELAAKYTLSVMAGDEELDYWTKIHEAQTAKKMQKKKRKDDKKGDGNAVQPHAQPQSYQPRLKRPVHEDAEGGKKKKIKFDEDGNPVLAE